MAIIPDRTRSRAANVLKLEISVSRGECNRQQGQKRFPKKRRAALTPVAARKRRHVEGRGFDGAVGLGRFPARDAERAGAELGARDHGVKIRLKGAVVNAGAAAEASALILGALNLVLCAGRGLVGEVVKEPIYVLRRRAPCA